MSGGIYGDDLVRTEYWELMVEGKKDCARGEMRKGIDKLMRCVVELSPTKWTNERYNMFMRYGHYLCNNDDAVTENDMQVLETKFMDNAQEPMLFRCKAALDLTVLKFKRDNREGSHEAGKKAVAFAEAMDLEERIITTKALRPDITGRPATCLVQDLLNDLEPRLDSVRKAIKFHNSFHNFQSYKLEDACTPPAQAANLDFVVDSYDKFGHSRYMSFQSVIFAVGTKDYPDADVFFVDRLEQQFVNNEEEPMLFRCAAACGLVQYHWHKGDHERASEYKTKACSFMQSADGKELDTKVRCLRHFFHEEGSFPANATVADVMGDLQEMYLGDEGPKQDEVTPDNKVNGVEMRNIIRSERIDPMTFVRRMVQGGDDCDFCMKEKEELGEVDRFACCAICEKAF